MVNGSQHVTVVQKVGDVVSQIWQRQVHDKALSNGSAPDLFLLTAEEEVGDDASAGTDAEAAGK